eukprot:1158689-Pelagomonas_calceolata.AAC.3
MLGSKLPLFWATLRLHSIITKGNVICYRLCSSSGCRTERNSSMAFSFTHSMHECRLPCQFHVYVASSMCTALQTSVPRACSLQSNDGKTKGKRHMQPAVKAADLGK